MLMHMESAGCREISIGIESADQEVLDALKKKTTTEDGWKALHVAREVGLVTRALMLIGTPGERPETLRYNLKFLLDAPYDMVCLTIFVPFPGCDIWLHPEAYRCDIVNRDLSTYNLYYYDSSGVRTVKPYVKLWDYDYESMTNNMDLMRRAALGLGGLNRG